MGAFVTGYAFPGIATGEEPVYGMNDDIAQRPVPFRIYPVPTLLKLIEMMIDKLK